jgi:hypothetical protein
MYRAEWLESLNKTKVVEITWIYCPGHAGVRGKEEADRLAVSAPVGSQLLYDKRDVISALWDKVWRESEDSENVYVDRMRLKRVARGSGRHSSLQGKARRIFNQITTGTISVDTLRWLLRRGTEHVWVCPDCNDVYS